MNYIDEEQELVVNNETDYSNIIAEIEGVAYLVQYFDNTYQQFLNLCLEDEKRNESLKYEFKNYNYKKSYLMFNVYIRQKNYNSITCESFNSFVEMVKNGLVRNVDSLEIKMELNYQRGKISAYVKHDNQFKIVFKPYNIVFIRKSNHNEEKMNMIEKEINEIMKKFRVIDSIFCTKEIN